MTSDFTDEDEAESYQIGEEATDTDVINSTADKTEQSDDDDVATELLGGFKVELTPSILAEEVVSETRVFGAAKNNQLGTNMNHGQIVDQIGTILTEGGAATSPLPASTKKKKEEEKEKERETTFVKDRGKSTTSKRWRQWRMGGDPRRDQNLSNGRSSASASEKKKTTEEAAVVKDRGKLCVAVRVGGRRGSVTAAKYHGSSKKQGGGCEDAWSRRVAMRRRQWSGPEVRWQRCKAEDHGKVRIGMKRGGGKARRDILKQQSGPEWTSSSAMEFRHSFHMATFKFLRHWYSCLRLGHGCCDGV